jgi:phosphoglycerol transferase MdoB-like AlkP superfamily enzyme
VWRQPAWRNGWLKYLALVGDLIFLTGVIIPLVIGLALSIAIEQLLSPRPPLLGRPWRAWAIHIGIFVGFYAVELLIFQRPYFVSAMVLLGVLLLVLVSNAKAHSLREPFIYQDFEYFLDALKHPRLYLPFLGVGRAAAALVAFIAAVYVGLMIEPAITQTILTTTFLQICATLFVFAVLLVMIANTDALAVSFEPNNDLQGLGLLAFLMRYRREERKPIEVSTFNSPFNGSTSPPKNNLPNIIVVQSESFFDARRLFADFDPSVMHEWDKTLATAAASGRVGVAAWGANTVRTEFAFLSGLDPAALGVHRFNPYRKMAQQGVPTLSSFLKKMGYRTICVHPYPASFYARDTVFPVLGFDEFIDVSAFAQADKFGPYIGDIALGEKVNAVLRASTQPTFIFVITMENHGPLHWEHVSAEESAALFNKALPAGCESLAVYARHLRNANTMLGGLRSHLETSATPSCLCWYGDHVPIMPTVYAALGEPSGATDFFIWSNVKNPQPSITRAVENTTIENLGIAMLNHAGFSLPAAAKKTQTQGL